MFTVTSSNVTIVAKIQRSKTFVHPVVIAKRLEKVACSFLLNVKNAALRGYFILIPRQTINEKVNILESELENLWKVEEIYQ
jgi:hypothetical protein